jgi:hypothetical protein
LIITGLAVEFIQAKQRTMYRYSTRKWFLIAAAAILAIYVLFDLYAPRQTDIRQFDPQELGRLDTEMWRSYYDRHPVRLFGQLAELMRTQYNAPFFRSNLMAFYAAKAAFVFKDGHNRAEHTQALPYLVDFYSAIEAMSTEPFDVKEAARLELEWWIVHRQRATHQSGDLENALAEAAAAIYHVPAEHMLEYARLRAEAMRIRDSRAQAGGLTEADWARIQQLLHASWQSFWKAVN